MRCSVAALSLLWHSGNCCRLAGCEPFPPLPADRGYNAIQVSSASNFWVREVSGHALHLKRHPSTPATGSYAGSYAYAHESNVMTSVLRGPQRTVSRPSLLHPQCATPPQVTILNADNALFYTWVHRSTIQGALDCTHAASRLGRHMPLPFGGRAHPTWTHHTHPPGQHAFSP